MKPLHLAILCAALVVLDAALTSVAFAHGIAEANPVMIALTNRIGATPALIVRAYAGVIVPMVLLSLDRFRVARVALALLAGQLVVLMCWHAVGLAALL